MAETTPGTPRTAQTAGAFTPKSSTDPGREHPDETPAPPAPRQGQEMKPSQEPLSATRLLATVNADGEQGQFGCGPRTRRPFSQQAYHHATAGWGAARSVGEVLLKEQEPVRGVSSFLKINQGEGGFDCPGCAWPDDQRGLTLDFCENGVKHTTWEMTRKRNTPEFFAQHTVSELATWTDYELENVGRLTHPMSYDPATDKYVPISWEDAFQMVGDHLRGLDSPDEASFYTSGRLSNEATWVYQLWVREFGTNNLPDCSNMCHEASGRALQASIGTGKGTVDMIDWENADALFIMGVNAGSNAPRMMTALAEAHRRNAKIVHINPLVEAASRGTTIPHELAEMALNRVTETSTLNLQVRPGGDMALMRGIAKILFELSEHDDDAIDKAFIDAYTHGVEEYRRVVESTPWDQIIEQSGIPYEQILQAAQIYRESERTVISWCLGVTQHEHAVDQIREIVNVLLLRGNIGRLGAGPSPVRGHSNVQGNRTCGVTHRPTEPFLKKLDELYGISAPRHHGLDTVDTINAMDQGRVRVFVSMGGNFVTAAPDTTLTMRAMAQCDLTVQVSTKLNRSHIVHGRQALILPCLGRTEKDVQQSGEQCVSVEDAFAMVHASWGMKRPASEHLRSEIAILTGMARATLPESAISWEGFCADYDVIRRDMAQVLPGFEDFSSRVREPHGFRIAQPARRRDFSPADHGMANFSAAQLPVMDLAEDELVLGTMRSHDQWNTTIYSNHDRYRGVRNIRTLIFMNPEDMRARGLSDGDLVDITATSVTGNQRRLKKYRVFSYDLPPRSASGYMPEMNVLIGVEDYSTQSDQPLMKSVRVRVTAAA